MPDLKISQLPVATTPLAGTELVPIVQGGTTDQTTVQAIMTSTVPSGTANGVLYLNGSKVATSGTAMIFDGTNLGIGVSPVGKLDVYATGTTIGYVRTANQTLKLTADDSGNRVDLANVAGNPMSFTIGVTEGMRLTSTGLGIGTSSPLSKLVVSNGSNKNLEVQPGATTYLIAYDRTAGDYLPLDISGEILTFGTDTGGEKMRLDASGNLGLGVTPSAWGSTWRAQQFSSWGAVAVETSSTGELSVSNNTYASAVSTFRYIGSFPATNYRQANGAHAWLTAPSGTAGNAISFSQVMTLDASGNLQLGATSGSGNRLNVVGTGGIRVNEDGASTKVITIRSDYAGIDPSVMVSSNHGLLFGTNNTERARITSGGDLLVGQVGTGPLNSNSLAIAPANTGGIDYNHVNGTASGIMYARFNLNATTIGSITQDGTTAVLYNTTSDARLKTNIVDAPEASALIDSIKVRSFDWLSDDSHQRYGMVAQELAEVAPEAVHAPADPDEMMAVDYSKLVPMLIKEIQSLRARVAALESQP